MKNPSFIVSRIGRYSIASDAGKAARYLISIMEYHHVDFAER